MVGFLVLGTPAELGQLQGELHTALSTGEGDYLAANALSDGLCGVCLLSGLEGKELGNPQT